MSTTTALRDEIKKTFLPFAEARGFALVRQQPPLFTEFRRIRGETAQLFDIQWEKYGKPRFVINFGACPTDGLTVGGKRRALDEVMAGWTNPGGRLQPGTGGMTTSWFRQDKALLLRLVSPALYPPERPVAELVALFPEIEAWWENGARGPHLRLRPPVPGH